MPEDAPGDCVGEEKTREGCRLYLRFVLLQTRARLLQLSAVREFDSLG